MPQQERTQELIALQSSLTMSADNEIAEIMLYGVIVSSTAFWKWIGLKDLEDKSADDFDKALKAAQKSGAKKLNVRINSPGGIVPQAVAMRTMLLGAKFDEIVIHIDGLCASSATLLACIPNARVVMAEGSEFMIHRPRYGAWGTVDELASGLQRLQAVQENFVNIYANHTKQDTGQIEKWMAAEKWFTAQAALDAGFVHEVYKGEQEAVACVSPKMMQAMKALYEHIPDDVAEEAPAAEEPQEPVSPDNPTVAAGISPENKKDSEEDTETMANENKPDVKTDIKDMTLDQLRAENPALYASVMKTGGEEERQRIEDIDALTPNGYEDMAAEAKKNGTSAMDFHKKIVAAQREKGEQFKKNRVEETATGSAVPGAASEEADPKNNTTAIAQNAKDIAAFAKEYSGSPDGTMH